ncbi:MAG: lipopolysaccharide biosynthesis protein [Phycisphaeraceae bacterium]
MGDGVQSRVGDTVRAMRGPGWALADHGIFAAAGFVAHVLLARHLAIEAYAGFAMAFSAVVGFGLLTRAMLSEPMLIFGGRRYRRRQRAYIGLVVLLQLPVGLGGAVVMLAVGWVCMLLGYGVVGAALAGGVMLQYSFSLLMLMRRAGYLRRRPWIGALAGGVYLAATVAGLALLLATARVTLLGGLAVVSAATLAGGLCGLALVRPGVGFVVQRRRIGCIVRRHVRYGWWALGASACRYVPREGYVLLLPMVGTLAEVAGLRAVRNVIAPAMLVSAALSSLLTPRLARLHGQAAFFGTLRRATVAGALPLGAVWFAMACFPETVLRLAYGDRFAAYGQVLWLAGLIPLAALVQTMAGTALRAMERPDVDWWCTLTAVVVSLPVGLGVTVLEPVGRALVGMLVYYVVFTFCAMVWLKRIEARTGETVASRAAVDPDLRSQTRSGPA